MGGYPGPNQVGEQGNKEGSPRLPLGEERTNILLLACCYQEGSNPKRHNLCDPEGIISRSGVTMPPITRRSTFAFPALSKHYYPT
jgi:hypothetical protein